MRVLVTGASGFIGRAVCRALLDAGFDVRAALRRMQSPAIDDCENVVVGDINGATDWAAALDGTDAIVHLAARTHSRDGRDARADYRRINVDGTLALRDAALAARVHAFVFMSSIKVNGETSPPDGAGRPLRFSGEDVPAPTTPYGESKLAAERALRPANEGASMRTVILRPPLVYGPGHKGNLARLGRAIDRGWPLPLGSLSALRSLIGVDNLADAVVACVRAERNVSGTFTLADTDISTAQLIRELAAARGRRARLVRVPVFALKAGASLFGLRAEFDKMAEPLLVDSERFRAASRWKPRRNLREGLRREETPG